MFVDTSLISFRGAGGSNATSYADTNSSWGWEKHHQDQNTVDWSEEQFPRVQSYQSKSRSSCNFANLDLISSYYGYAWYAFNLYFVIIWTFIWMATTVQKKKLCQNYGSHTYTINIQLVRAAHSNLLFCLNLHHSMLLTPPSPGKTPATTNLQKLWAADNHLSINWAPLSLFPMFYIYYKWILNQISHVSWPPYSAIQLSGRTSQ